METGLSRLHPPPQPSHPFARNAGPFVVVDVTLSPRSIDDCPLVALDLGTCGDHPRRFWRSGVRAGTLGRLLSSNGDRISVVRCVWLRRYVVPRFTGVLSKRKLLQHLSPLPPITAHFLVWSSACGCHCVSTSISLPL